MAHLPFGEDFGESGTQEKHHLTSYERDGESGTDYAVNRQYAQAVGRFNRLDPVRGASNSPQSLNRYTYVRNDPSNRVDPLGLYEECGWEGNCIVCYDQEGHRYEMCPGDLPSFGDGNTALEIVRDPGPAPGGSPNRQKAKFKLAKLKECASILFGAEIRSFDYQSGRVEIYGPDRIRNSGNNATYLVAFNFENTGAQLAAMPPVDPDVTWEFGAYFESNPYVALIASDIAAHTGNDDFVVTIATMVHELAHALNNIGGVAGDISPDDAGERMERCVFGGVVQGDGYAYP